MTGRVNDIFNNVFEKIEGANKDNTIIYACGHPEMVSDISKKNIRLQINIIIIDKRGLGKNLWTNLGQIS